jgi:hypothetical protein
MYYQIEETAPFTSELDDYQDEKREVLADQGTAFPYTRGFWLVSTLVAAINPDDLDAIDENVPFSKATLDDLMGRVHTPEEYQFYFERNPHAPLYIDIYPRLLNEPTVARAFVSKSDQARRERSAGYADGNRPSGNEKAGVFSFMHSKKPKVPTQTELHAQLAPMTAAARR